MNNNFNELNEQELIDILNSGNLCEREFDNLVKEMEKKGLSGSIMEVDPNDPATQEIVDYINFHEKLPKDYQSEKQINKAKKILLGKSEDLEQLKEAIMILAHSGELKSLEALKRYSKKPDHRLTVWVKTAIDECQAFLESKLLDKPIVKIKKI